MINLYQMYTGTAPSSTDIVELPFGDIQLLDQGNRSYTFQSLGYIELALPRQPFPYETNDKTGIREGYLKFQPGVVITSYLQALERGISKAALKLSTTDSPLPDRVRLLLQGMKKFSERDWNDPYLITQSWTEHASRIKRRATTNTGKDDLLMRRVQAFIAKDAAIVELLKAPLRDEQEWETLLASTLRPLFMFDEDKYEFIWNLNMELSSRKNPKFVAIVKDQLLHALEGFRGNG